MALDRTGSHSRHASWLNQIEIYFSIVQRKVLTPNDFSSVADLQHHLLAFQDHYQLAARPFHWTFTRTDLRNLLAPSTIIRFALPPDPPLEYVIVIVKMQH